MQSTAAQQASGTATATKPILEVADLAVSFANSAGGPRIQAVAGVSMTVHPTRRSPSSASPAAERASRR